MAQAENWTTLLHLTNKKSGESLVVYVVTHSRHLTVQFIGLSLVFCL